jgi:hypothetical protein
MRIGFLLLFMFVSGAGLLIASDALDSAWPLFGIWALYGLALPLASRGAEDDDPAAPPATTDA